MNADKNNLTTVERAAPAATLLPCPFCGSPGETVDDSRIGEPKWIAQCSNGDCWMFIATADEYCTPEEAISAWNRRSPDLLAPDPRKGSKMNLAEATKARSDEGTKGAQ
jgi:hypothetical protein